MMSTRPLLTVIWRSFKDWWRVRVALSPNLTILATTPFSGLPSITVPLQLDISLRLKNFTLIFSIFISMLFFFLILQVCVCIYIFGAICLTDQLVHRLQHGGDVNAADNTGQTALHWSAVRGSIQVAEILLQEGARVHAADMYGYQVRLFSFSYFALP